MFKIGCIFTHQKGPNPDWPSQLDMMPIPSEIVMSLDGTQCAQIVGKIHRQLGDDDSIVYLMLSKPKPIFYPLQND